MSEWIIMKTDDVEHINNHYDYFFWFNDDDKPLNDQFFGKKLRISKEIYIEYIFELQLFKKYFSIQLELCECVQKLLYFFVQSVTNFKNRCVKKLNQINW